MSPAWNDWGFWSWVGTATQSNAAGGVVVIDVSAGIGNILEILFARGVVAAAATETLAVSVEDEDNFTVVGWVAIAASTTATATIPRANTDIDSTTSSSDTTGLNGPALAGGDLHLSFRTSAMAQNDTLQVLLWARVKKGPGTVSVAQSTGTVAAPTVTVNEVY